MLTYTLSAPNFKLDDFYDHVDKVQVRLQDCPPPHWVQLLEQHCLHCDRARFDPKFGIPPWRLQVTVPDAEALRLLEGTLINRVEIAHEEVYPDWLAQECRLEHLNRHLWRPYERTGTNAFRIKGTTYSRQRRGPGHRLVRYTPKFSKLTGELHVVRYEWQAVNVAACRAIGVHDPTDLIAFDFDAFWAKRFRLFEVDVGKLGQILRGHKCYAKPTKKDIRVGGLALRIAQRDGADGEPVLPLGAVQDVIARFGNRAKRALVSL